MIVYVILIILIGFFLLVEKMSKGNKKISVIVLFGYITLISAIRSYSVGVDTVQYYFSFNYIINHSWDNILGLRYEVGFLVLCKLIGFFSTNPQMIIVCSSFIIFPVIGCYIYKTSENIALSTYFYLVLNLYFSHLNLMRQTLAICILLIGMLFLEKKHKKNFILCVLLATCFHYSAIVCLSYLIIEKIKYNKNSYIKVLCIAGILSIFCLPILEKVTGVIGIYSGYLGTSKFGVSNYFGAALKLLLYLLIHTICHFLYFSKYIEKEGMNENQSELFLKFSSIVIMLQAMTLKINIISRLIPYFLITEIILLVNILTRIKKSKTRLFLYCFFIVVLFAYWFVIVKYRPEWTGTVPYYPYWNDTIIDWSGYFG